MQIESQVCSFKLSILLKELNVPQNSLFYWHHDKGINYPSYGDPDDCMCSYNKISAFTVSELLEILPHRITIKNETPFNSFRVRLEKSFMVNGNPSNGNEINLECVKNIYIANYRCDSTGMSGEEAWLERTLFHNISDENPANALAKLLILGIENNYIEVKNNANNA